MAVSVVRLGSPRAKDEGLRIGTVRRLPRGVPKSEYASRDYFDVWLPELSPSEALVKYIDPRHFKPERWPQFARRYRAEMAKPPAARLVALLAALSHTADFSVGCYCEDESRCHRSLLRELLREQGAALRPPQPRATGAKPR